MKNMKKLAALVLALVMVLALGSVAFAADLNSNGVLGDTAFTQDNPTSQGKVIDLKKELTAFNADENYVYGPSFTYTYTVTPGDSGKSITDAASQHSSGVSTVALTLSGITTGMVVNSGTVGVNTQAQGTLVWSNSDILEADDDGEANYKNVTIDFSNVVFTQPGVYRYEITETPAASDARYSPAGITEGTSSRVRYLDVYVTRDAENYTDGTTAGQWMIYGYVCFYNNEDITAADATTVAVKTTGFVAGTSDGSTAVTADQYHTYNLNITKDLIGDNSMINHKFPFEVSFDTATNSKTGTFQLIEEHHDTLGAVTGAANVAAGAATVNDPTPTTGTTAAISKIGTAQVLSANPYAVEVADGNTTANATTGYVKLIGIPYGVIASVKETNDNIGTTYTTSVKEDYNGSGLHLVNITSTTGEEGTETIEESGETVSKKNASIDYNETVTRTAAASDHDIAVQFTNKLAVISPTGVVFRIAPYMLMLGVGIFLLMVTRRRREEETAA